MQSPAVSALLKTLVFMFPSQVTIALERCLSGACTTIGGSTSTSSSIADLIEDRTERAKAFTQMGLATGLGLVAGPLISTAAVGKSGNPGRAFAAGALVSALHFLYVSSTVNEPLSQKKRKPMPAGGELLKSLNPLAFYTLFTNGSVLARLVIVAALQFIVEGKSIADLNGYYLLNEAKLPDDKRALYNTTWGVVMTAGGKIGPLTIRKLGMRGHTTLQNFATALGLALTGATTHIGAIFAALPVHVFAMERGAAVRSMAITAADQKGMGSGEFAAKIANFRAIAVAIAPMLYARAYAAGLGFKTRMPGLPYFVGAAVVLLSEAIHRSLTDAQLNIKK